jgi:hypothetical protein
MTILGLGEREQGKQQMQRQQQIPYGMTKKLRQRQKQISPLRASR